MTYDSLLISWFRKNQRTFPWRESPTPYAVWVSEVMLQQTRASVVVPYFLHWLQLFPTIEALSGASIEDVIRAWEGLGYYSRARNLHKGAQLIVERFNGELPESEQDLKSIPGLGPYTIGAIRSFAFHQEAAAVDGNVMRVLTRLLDIKEDISKSSTQKLIRDKALDLLPKKNHWEFNEGLIELGATLCLPKNPNCSDCPIRSHCAAHKKKKTHLLPFKSKKQKVTKLNRAVLILIAENHVLLKKGKEGQIMQDLYEFPYIDIEKRNPSLSSYPKKFETLLQGQKIEMEKICESVSHGFTRYQATLFPAIGRLNKKFTVPDYEWIPLGTVKMLPFSSGHRKIREQLLSLCRT